MLYIKDSLKIIKSIAAFDHEFTRVDIEVEYIIDQEKQLYGKINSLVDGRNCNIHTW